MSSSGSKPMVAPEPFKRGQNVIKLTATTMSSGSGGSNSTFNRLFSGGLGKGGQIGSWIVAIGAVVSQFDLTVRRFFVMYL